MSCLQYLHSLSAAFPWYAVRTRSKSEQLAAAGLQAKGFQPYFPSLRVRRKWSDRIVNITVPFFPGYIFCRFDANEKLPILTTPGVASIVGFGNEPSTIPDSEIEAIETILRSGRHPEPCGFLRVGQPVRIENGALKGLEGLLLKKKSEWRLVISVNLLQRSLSVEIDKDWVSAL